MRMRLGFMLVRILLGFQLDFGRFTGQDEQIERSFICKLFDFDILRIL